MKILVVGGHGFVGRSLIKLMANSEHEVAARSRRDGLDLTDRAQISEFLAEFKPEAIVNCAAHVGSLHYVGAMAADVLDDNVRMALNLYRATKDACPRARIINPMSNCSYPGDADVHYEPDWWAGPVHESVYSYGNSKRLIYVAAECYRRQYGIRSVNFLVPNSFGPGDYVDPNRTHALNGLIIRMLQARREQRPEFEIWGTGAPLREWGYVEDIVRVLVEGLTIDEDLSYPVNIAQNKGYSIKESAELVARAIGYRGRLVFNTKYPDGAPRKILDDRRFRKLFPNFRFTDHEAGIRATVAYYQSVL